METDSQGYSLGTEMFPSRSEAIKSLITVVVDEFQSYEEGKKVIERRAGEEDATLNSIDSQISTNLRHCLSLLNKFEINGTISLDEKSKNLLNGFFKKSGRTPVVLGDQSVENTIKITHTLFVTTQSLKELKAIFKEFVPIKAVSVELAASLLRERDKTSGVSLVQKVLSLYAKTAQIPGYKEWRDKSKRYNNRTDLKRLESLGKPRITDFLLRRDYDLKSSFNLAISYLVLDLNDYSLSLVKTPLNESPE